MKQHSAHESEPRAGMATMHYRHLLIMTVVSFIAMFVLMYAMVNAFSNVFINVNQFYMAALMATPMVLIELVVMRAMYKDPRLSAVFAAASLVVLIGCWFMIRQQTGVTDRQFLRSMIPHHASAILMCQEAPVQDQRIKDLCKNIISGQRAEIDQMKRMLDEPR